MSQSKWPVVALSELAEKIMVGIASAATHAYVPSGIPMLRNLNIKEGWIDETDVLFIDEEYEYQHRNKRLREGDIITVRTGYPGISAVVPKKYEGAQCFTSLIIRPNEYRLNPHYFCQVINSEYGKRLVTASEAGGAQKNLNAGSIESFPVPLPSLAEQQNIVRIASIWDQAIATTERLLVNSLRQKQMLAQRMLTGKVRLHEFGDSGNRRETPYGSLPSDWGYWRIGEVAVEVSQKLGGTSPYPVLSCTKHHGLVDSLSYFNKQIYSLDTSTYKVVPRGCFVYATNHIDEGSIGHQDLYDFGLVSPMYTAFKVNEDVFDAYLFALLKTEHYRQIFASATNASVDRRGSLRWKDFRNLHIPVPPIDEQKAIANVLTLAEREADLIKGQLELLREEKAALMVQLLTGKRRVHLIDAETEAQA